ERRVGTTRADAVDADVLARQLAGERSREQDDAALGGAVRLVHRLALQARLRRHVHDGAVPAPPEMRQRLPAAEIDRTKVDGENPIPRRWLHAIEGDEASHRRT